MTLDDLYNVDILEKFLKYWALNKTKNIAEKDDFKFKDDFLWPLMTSEVILHFMKNLHIYIDSIHRNFYQNRFVNECPKKKKA